MRHDELPGRSRRLSRAGLVISAGLAICLAAPGIASATPNGPGATPPRPTVGQYSGAAAPALTSTELKRLAAKQSRARNHFQARLAQAATVSGVTPNATSATLAVGYQQQINEDFCGAATTAMITSYLGIGWSGSASNQQTKAGHLLATDEDGNSGTAWYGTDNVPSYPGSSWYPVQDALNYLLYTKKNEQWYQAVPLPGSPSGSQASQYEQDLVFDVDEHFPVAANQDSVPGYQIGYQPSGYWQHWWVGRGYAGTGATTYFNDPASWSKGRMSSAPSWGGDSAHHHTVVEALGARGYVW